MKKVLKLWNGRGHGRKYDKGSLYVAAYSRAEAVRLINKACDSHITDAEIRVYYSAGVWGDVMKGITPTEPCVYATDRAFGGKPKRIL